MVGDPRRVRPSGKAGAVHHGSVTDVPDFAALTRLPEVRSYLGHLLEAA
jgi:hypothetical protein